MKTGPERGRTPASTARHEGPLGCPDTTGIALIPPKEAARRLCVSLRTLRTLIAQGRLRVVRVSARRIAIHPADLDDYIERRRG